MRKKKNWRVNLMYMRGGKIEYSGGMEIGNTWGRRHYMVW